MLQMIFLSAAIFSSSYSAGMGYKIYYTLGVKAIENELYLTGYKWEEHDSGPFISQANYTRV